MTPRTTTRIAVRARALRKAMTEPEIMFWSRLKGRGLDRPIFRRQVAYESMIFDFYCPGGATGGRDRRGDPLGRGQAREGRGA
jgi:very-short-patch-repair endonuclease